MVSPFGPMHIFSDSAHYRTVRFRFTECVVYLARLRWVGKSDGRLYDSTVRKGPIELRVIWSMELIFSYRPRHWPWYAFWMAKNSSEDTSFKFSSLCLSGWKMSDRDLCRSLISADDASFDKFRTELAMVCVSYTWCSLWPSFSKKLMTY